MENRILRPSSRAALNSSFITSYLIPPLRKSKQWQEELQKLRTIILDCQLTEEVKWRVPCYTFQESNIVIMGRLKECCVLSFVKGALLNDTNGILVKPGENTQSARVIQSTNVQQIVKMKPILKAYIHETIEVEKSGLKVNFKIRGNTCLKPVIAALTPGRQRAYFLYFSAAKQPRTRESRVEKWM